MLSISSYFSVAYLGIFLPLTILLYAILPKPLRRGVLLLASYLFFFFLSGKLLVFLLVSTVSIYAIGLWLEKLQQACSEKLKSAEHAQRKALRKAYQLRKRWVLALGALINLGILLTLKYTPFFASLCNLLLAHLPGSHQLTVPSFVLPIGISFYTMQAMSYLFDVYWSKIPADRNLLRLALYMSFFPQLMEGPICRWSDTAERLYDAPPIQFAAFKAGAWHILWGMVKKIVVADRINLLVKTVFNQYESYDGFVIALAAVCYTLQLYMDFSGTIDVTIGTGQIFGIELKENFRQPFFSRSISEFWRRWHITLGAWLKDYIFFPVSMAGFVKRFSTASRRRLGKHLGSVLSSSIALFCVWVCNGLWHGAALQYLFYGMYHFTLILSGELLAPLFGRITTRLGISRDSRPFHLWQIFRTTVLVCVGELFFAANGLRAGFAMFRKIFTNFTLNTLQDGTLFTLGMDRHDFLLVALMTVFFCVVSVCKENGIALDSQIKKKNTVIRFAAYYLPIMLIIVFGAYGSGYVAVDPMYARF